MKDKVLYDLDNFPLKKNEGGLYSILPYERLNRGKALFKVGLADNFDKRFENYHTDYPIGFYIKNLLASPTKHKEDFKVKPIYEGLRPSPEEKTVAKKATNIKYLKHVEKFVFKEIKENGGKQLRTTTRVREANENGGVSEWFYTNERTLDNAFKEAKEKFGGKNLENHLKNINEIADKNQKKSNYKAEIYYKI
jgi:hypothetical protein